MSQITSSEQQPESGTRAEETRSRLLQAAVASFATKGFHGTTTRDIAAAAGMSPAALYVHHRSKEDLLYLISRAGHERTLSLLREAAASSDDPVEQLEAMVRGFVTWHARRHTQARIVNHELAALSPAHLTEVAALRRGIEHELRTVIDRGVRAGVFSTPNTHMTALAILSLGVDLARWYRDDGSWSPEEIAEHYCALARRMVAPD